MLFQDFGKLIKTLELVETRETTIELEDVQAQQLNRLSKELASTKSWWGAEADHESDTRVISVNPQGLGLYRVTVRDSVGVISLPGLKIIVKPKIRESHFSYIARYALFGEPRTAPSDVSLAKGGQFHELIISWFIDEVNGIHARGLQSDYESMRDGLLYVRGRVNVAATYRDITSGRLSIDCEFEERTTNTQANRILASAIRQADFSAIPSADIQTRGSNLRSVFRGIPNVTPQDLHLSLSQVEKRYRRAVEFGLAILRSSGRSLSDGAESSRTFLVRTPLLIEMGIRKILAEGLKPISVTKNGKALTAAMTVNPDLTIARPPFTADIKYKNRSDKWNRADLAQGVFFAEAFRSPIAAVVSFSNSSIKLPNVPVGNIMVSSIDWNLAHENPAMAANQMVAEFAKWLPAHEVDWHFPLGWVA